MDPREMGRKGGRARAKALSAKKRQEIARLGGQARMKKTRKAADENVLHKGAAKRAKSAISDMEKAIQTREEWLRLAAEGSQLGLWYWNRVSGRTYWDPKCYELLGLDPNLEPSFELFLKMIHPSDRARIEERWHYRIENPIPMDQTYRIQTPDGGIRWVHFRSRAYHDKTKKSHDVIGVAFDITESKEHDKERDDLARRLLNAQDEERTRLARDLHDNVGQKLFVASIALQKMFKTLDNPAAAQQVAELLKTLDEIVTDALSLSQKLQALRPLS